MGIVFPRSRWNNWNNCWNSTVQSRKNPTGGEGVAGQEGEQSIEWMDSHSLNGERRCDSLFPLWYVYSFYKDKFGFLRLCFALDLSQAASSRHVGNGSTNISTTGERWGGLKSLFLFWHIDSSRFHLLVFFSLFLLIALFDVSILLILFFLFSKEY